MTDLKPCPFCGSKNLSCFNDGYLIQIFCNACGARTDLFKPDPERDKAVEAWNRRAETVKDQPDGDVVEVVRCKDCKYLMFSDCYGECKLNHFRLVRPDDFCSRGKRKEGDENG